MPPPPRPQLTRCLAGFLPCDWWLRMAHLSWLIRATCLTSAPPMSSQPCKMIGQRLTTARWRFSRSFCRLVSLLACSAQWCFDLFHFLSITVFTSAVPLKSVAQRATFSSSLQANDKILASDLLVGDPWSPRGGKETKEKFQTSFKNPTSHRCCSRNFSVRSFSVFHLLEQKINKSNCLIVLCPDYPFVVQHLSANKTQKWISSWRVDPTKNHYSESRPLPPFGNKSLVMTNFYGAQFYKK